MQARSFDFFFTALFLLGVAVGIGGGFYMLGYDQGLLDAPLAVTEIVMLPEASVMTP